jgi:hypothetical protein
VRARPAAGCPGFDQSVLSEFRTRVTEHGLEDAVLDALLDRLTADGLLKARGKQRTGSTHVIAAVRGLYTIELAGKAGRDKLLIEFARDGYALVAAYYEDSAPAWAREIPAGCLRRAG